MLDSSFKLQLSINGSPAQHANSLYLAIASKHSTRPVHASKTTDREQVCSLLTPFLSTSQILSCNTLFSLYKRQQMRLPALEVTIISQSTLIHFIFMNKLHLCSHTTHHCTIVYRLRLFQNSGVLFLWLKTLSANTNIPCFQPLFTIFKSLLISFSYKLEKFSFT